MTNAKPTRDPQLAGAADAQPGSSSDETRPGTPEARSLGLFELDAPPFPVPRSAAADSGARSDDPDTIANNNGVAAAGESISPETIAQAELIAEAEEKALEQELLLLADSHALPDSDAAALTAEELIAAQAATSISTPATRAATHAPESERFDELLDAPPVRDADSDPRLKLSFRFKSSSAAYRVLGPLSSTTDRRELVSLLRNYEVALRRAGNAAGAASAQLTDALHSSLSKEATDELEKSIGKLEDKLLFVDESVADEAFRMRWTKQRETPKTLLRYARLLASRRFNIGFRRDRFEVLAQELLTAKTPHGALMLMPRAKAGPVLRQLLRGLPSSQNSPEDRLAAHTYLRDALDRLRSLQGPKQFFDSGFFLDVHGYKVSMPDHITNPEFLFLCVALNVEIHNRLLSWSRPASEPQRRSNANPASAAQSAPPLAALQAQLREQEQAVQDVFANFRRPREIAPLTAMAPAVKKSTEQKRSAELVTTRGFGIMAFASACALLMVTVLTNLFTTGVVTLREPPAILSQPELHALSPLLLRGSLTAKGRHFSGLMSRPAWQHLPPEQRRAIAARLAKNLEQRGVHKGEVLVYKSRAIEFEYGSVQYVDDAK